MKLRVLGAICLRKRAGVMNENLEKNPSGASGDVSGGAGSTLLGLLRDPNPFARTRHRARSGWNRYPAFLALALLGASAARADVGRSTGTFHVDDIGAATYTIPIWAPRGPAGLEPHIALTYDSEGDVTPVPVRVGPRARMEESYASDLGTETSVGVGWSVAGLSVITRCNKTVAEDGAASSISLMTIASAYCLDGQRLRLTSGTYGTAGSTYQTEIDNFSEITAKGTEGDGPSYWVVQGRDGVTYEFGTGGNSQVSGTPSAGTQTAYQWWLDKVTDPAGNTMTITYSTANASYEVVPDTISWTPSTYGSTTYNYAMKFAYQANSNNQTYGYVDGLQYGNDNLLQSITIEYQGSVVKEYFLDHQPSSATTRELLTKVTECADSAKANCLGPTSFSYQGSQIGVATGATPAASGVGSILVAHYDFNGDGRDDLAYCNGSSPNTIEVSFASTTGYGAPIDTHIACGALYGDLLGKGTDGILENNGGTWYYYTWNGSSFSGVSTALAYDSGAMQYALADVDGDGRPDLIETMQCANCAYYIYVRLNTSAGSTPSFSGTNAQWFSAPYSESSQYYLTVPPQIQSNTDFQQGNLRKLDFNGDGRADLAVELDYEKFDRFTNQTTDDLSTYELISTGSSFSSVLISDVADQQYKPVAFMNFNDDACTDYLLPQTTLTPAYIEISGCNDTVASTITLPSNIQIAAVLDWNGDGRDDLLVGDTSTGVIDVYLSAGNALGSTVPTLVPFQSSNRYFTFEPDGDGRDLGVQTGSTVSYYVDNSSGHPPDMLTDITDGYGNSIEPSYISLVQGTGSTYTPGSSPPSGYKPYTQMMYVVNTVTYSEPSGSSSPTYTRTHSYSGALQSIDGRGYAGFSTHTVVDSRVGLREVMQFDQVFPYTGMLTEDDLSQSDGTAISTTTYTNADKVLDSTQYNERHFPYASLVTTERYEVGGSENGKEITKSTTNYSPTSASPDSDGNFTAIDTTITDEDSESPYVGEQWETDTSAQYADDTSTWCLALPTSMSIAKTAPNQPVLTHAVTYTPDDAKCHEKSEVEDAGNSSYDVTRAFSYDNFGNVSQISVTGASMTARVWNYGWGATGQFQETIRDPVATAEGYEEKITYDYGLGLKKTDVIQTIGGSQNTQPTQWFYDDFGRPKQEIMPDGTSLNWSPPTLCSQTTCYNGAYYVVSETAEDIGGAEVTDQSIYLDSFDRTIAGTTRLMDGSYALTERNYDALGNVVKQSAPCIAATCTLYWTQTQYDAINRPTKVLSPDPENPGTQDETQIGYVGGQTRVTNAKGQNTTRTVDVTGALRQIRDYGGEGDYVATRWDQALGAWAYSPDALGEVTSYSDAKNQVFHQLYDGLGRLTERDDAWTPSGSETVTTWTWGHTPSAHDVGDLDQAQTTTSSGTYSESSQYDSDGRIAYRDISIPGDTNYQYGFTYDPKTGLLSQLQYPAAGSSSGLSVNYVYQYGHLAAVKDANTGVAYWTGNAVNEFGEISQDTLGNGIVTQRSFTPVTGWLTKAISGPTAGSYTVQNQSYLYDPLGNVIQRQDGKVGLTENFFYDSDNRLLYSSLTNGSATTTNLQLTYNPNGSIAQKTETGGTDDPVAYTVPQWTSYNYPQSINATLASGDTEGATFNYGPDRQRWRMVYTEGSASETTEYIGGLMEKVSSTSATDYRYYVYGSSGLATVVDIAGSTVTPHYVLEDHEGSISALLDPTGGLLANESFTAFGNRRDPSTWSGPPSSTEEGIADGVTRQGFTGQTVLGQMGLNHMNGRVEDAVTGTFLTPDPYVADPTNGQDYYRYAYVYNNPLTYIDPTGFVCDLDNLFQNGCEVNAPPELNICIECIFTPLSPPESWPEPDIPSDALPRPGSATTTPNSEKPQQTTHHYKFTAYTLCTAPDNMNALESPGASAPGAPAAHDGTTNMTLPPLASVWGGGGQSFLPSAFFTPNPIQQFVSTSNGVINNTATQGHIFFPGSANTTVTPMVVGSTVQTIGQGGGNFPFLNDALGFLFFGLRNYAMAISCYYTSGNATPLN